jgi:hypothetical protein
MKYKLIIAYEQAELEQMVQDAIQDGYAPLGGVCATCIPDPQARRGADHTIRYTQAVIKQ